MSVLGLIRLPHSNGLELPRYETASAAGLDLRAAIDIDKTVTISPNERALIPTGLIFELENGFEAQIRPRSGLALKHGITVLNSPGTIDSDYRGEIMVLLINLGHEDFIITRGMRIAQAIIAPVHQVTLEERSQTQATKRGTNGFGSTGML